MILEGERTRVRQDRHRDKDRDRDRDRQSDSLVEGWRERAGGRAGDGGVNVV